MTQLFSDSYNLGFVLVFFSIFAETMIKVLVNTYLAKHFVESFLWGIKVKIKELLRISFTYRINCLLDWKVCLLFLFHLSLLLFNTFLFRFFSLKTLNIYRSKQIVCFGIRCESKSWKMFDFSYNLLITSRSNNISNGIKTEFFSVFFPFESKQFFCLMIRNTNNRLKSLTIGIAFTLIFSHFYQ